MMNASDKKPVPSDFAQMIIGGVRKAVLKMAEEAAEKEKALL